MEKKLGEIGTDYKVVSSINGYRFYLDKAYIAKLGVEEAKVRQVIVDYLRTAPHVMFAADFEQVQTMSIPDVLRQRMLMGYHPRRSGDIVVVLEPGYYEFGSWSSPVGTTHSAWNPYDAHIPLLFYGWRVDHGSTSREVHITDIAPTVTQMLHIQQPNACVGEAIQELTK